MAYCIQIYPQGFYFFDIPEMTFKNGNVNMKTGSEHVGNGDGELFVAYFGEK